ncbi:MAG: GIY-YIG nuclease family protein [bacterium]
MKGNFYVYILCSKKRGTLYVGVTSNLPKRVYEHKNGIFEGFKKKYGVHRPVYYEVSKDAETALLRERQIRNGTGHGSSGSSMSTTQNGQIYTTA